MRPCWSTPTPGARAPSQGQAQQQPGRDHKFPSPAWLRTIPMPCACTHLPSRTLGVTAGSKDVLGGLGAGSELPHQLQPDSAVGARH